MTKPPRTFLSFMFSNKKTSNRKFLNSIWLAFILSFLGTFLNYIFCFLGDMDYVKHHIFIPIFILLILMLIAEILCKFFKNIEDITVIITSSLFVSVLVYVNINTPALQTAYILPMLVSISYFELKKIIISFVFNISSLTIIYFINPFIYQNTTLGHIITIILILTISFFISIGIMFREKEMLEHIKITMQSKQDLLIKNIIMEQTSKIDPLTGLYNHGSFHKYLDILIEQGRQNNLSIHLAILDIDDFKQVNDQYGHGVGDLILKRISNTIKYNISCNDFPCRYGGEEFAVIFTDINLTEAFTTIDNIRQMIKNTYHEELQGKSVTISIGLQEYGKKMDKQTLFEKADTLLYEAKATGKDKTLFQSNNL